MPGSGAAFRDGRDTGLQRSSGCLEIRLAFNPAVQKKVIELALSGMILEKAENKLGNQRSYKTGKDADQQSK